ncbi:ABC-F family ATP-binding cassette domain-containing protein [Thermostaphylospora chromogena]|uniref:ATPase components of ABC transporters with duplicated ATPase domains n=1 Tax=Thermostaphylospora chromogena TaxID=35622 RepID=A0A1H1C6L9_9ACTN|nr:ATP-binding cassette domain-containing protein [Thermostaphylospora chromogena]SDQ59774.1 ATPase components of ABC transporters with duplicated ATPase domains [Thermostaphylospora chromogena]
MGHVEVAHLTYVLPDGRTLLNDVSFRVGDGVKAALIGPNGAGKTTLIRLIAGDVRPTEGSVASSGGLGVMRQFIGGIRDDRTIRDLLLSVAPEPVQQAAARLEAAELAMMERDDTKTQMRYAQAITDYTDAGGYDIEVLWDTCTVAALGLPYDEVKHRSVNTLSGGEQKRLVLEALLRGPDQTLLLDEPDNYLDVPGKLWLEQALRETPKTVLLVSHDRQLLANAVERIITVEAGDVWIHGGGFAGYAQARRERNERLEELRRRWDEEHAKLKRLVNMLKQKASYNDAMAPAYHAAQTRLRRFEEAGPPQIPPRDQRISMRLRGGRTGKRAITCEGLELTGLMKPFDLEVWYGERVAVLGSNGSGKSHFLRLLAGEDVRHTGVMKLGARVVPGHFAQTHTRPDLMGRTPCEIVMTEHAKQRDEAMHALARYELAGAVGDQRFETLSGGQQARLQILLLELSGATLLLLDEPTDNLDLASAEALQEGLEGFDGTVLAVTHDRWFAADFDRYLIFGGDGRVYESPEPVWDESRVVRPR